MEPNQMPQTPSQGPDKKMLIAVVLVLVILAAGYLLATRYEKKAGPEEGDKTSETAPLEVTVTHTERVNGVLPPPPGFPTDIPVEKTDIRESATTQYPTLDAKQLSLNYQTSKTIAQKVTEYRDYMKKAGYTVSEGSASAPVKALFGTKDDANLTVVISNAGGGKTLVQVAYLLK